MVSFAVETMNKTKVALLISSGEATVEGNSTASVKAWAQFMRIRYENKLLPFVQCIICKHLFSHDSKSTGTGTLQTHMKGCKKVATAEQGSNGRFVKQEVVNAADKGRMTTAISKWCAVNLRYEFTRSARFGSVRLFSFRFGYLPENSVRLRFGYFSRRFGFGSIKNNRAGL